MRSGSTMAYVGAAWAGGLGATVGAGLGLFGVATQSHAQVVYHIPNTVITDIADDGTVIGSLVGQGSRDSFTWTPGGGINRWGLDPTIPGTRNSGFAISGDGSTYFGYVESGANMGMFRYRGPGTYQFIPNPAQNYLSIFTRASRTGDAAVGYAYNYTIPFASHVAVRWTAQTGTVALGFGADSDANDISADGNTIVGSGYDGGGVPTAWRWTASGGSRRLAGLPGSEWYGSHAYAITGDGTVITGFSGADDAVVWRNGVVESLGRIDGYHYAKGRSISDDASIIVGDLQGNAPGSLSWTGFVWTRDHGMELIGDFFARIGVTTLPQGWSESRRWLVASNGQMLYTDGYEYIVTIPSPSAAIALLSTLIQLSARRRRP